MEMNICRLFRVVFAAVLFLAVQLRAEVIYERQVTEAEKERYDFSGGSKNYFERGRTTEDIRREYRAIDWSLDRNTIKVELLHDDKDNGRPYIRIGCLGEDLIAKAQSRAWASNAISQYAVGRNTKNYSYMGVAHAALERRADREDLGFMGMLVEAYTGSKGGVADVQIDSGRGCSISPQEVMRLIIHGDLSHRKTDHGVVLVSVRKKDNQRWIVWTSGKDLAFYVSSLGGDPMELAEVYLDKFPSSLPKDIDLDKLAWGRAEVDHWLRKMKKCLDGEIGTDNPAWADKCLYMIISCAYVPFDDVLMARDSKEEKQRMYDRLVLWWAEGKAKAYWDEKRQLLIVKGQAPEDIARAKQAAAEEKVRQILATPLTQEQEENARVLLIQKYEAEARAKAKSLRGAFTNDVRIRFEKQEERCWIVQYPSYKGSLITETISGPAIAKTKDRRQPLKGVFAIKRQDPTQPGTGELDYAEEFVYDIITMKWSRCAGR